MKANRANGFLVGLEKILDDLFRSHHSTHVKLMQIKCAVRQQFQYTVGDPILLGQSGGWVIFGPHLFGIYFGSSWRSFWLQASRFRLRIWASLLRFHNHFVYGV